MTSHLPQHIAFIMDGNGRWAQRRGLGRLLGHKKGIDTVRTVCEECQHLGVPFVTFYAFSTENWKRPLEEVSGLFDLMRAYFKKELADIIRKGMRVRFIGDRSPTSQLPPDILDIMADVESQTAHNTKLTAVFAINYSGRDELIRAAQTLADEGTPITPETLSAALDTSGIPDPDLIIRTSGEQRISNFLLWQLAYAELYFSEVAWPDFTSTHLQAALSNFTNRQRRFGAVPTATAA
jgi:undecaprenyl diphosphate synthase